jgi:tetratricopeptide (TPR) repeat protein
MRELQHGARTAGARPGKGWLLGTALTTVGSFAAAPPARAQLAQPPSGSTLTSRELAAQAQPVGGMYAYQRKLAEYVKARRVDVLQQHIDAQWSDYKRGELTDAQLNRMFNMVSEADEADAGAFDEWADKYPGSPIGPLARGYFGLHRAWQGRGDRFARDTTREQFAEMDRWLPAVRRDAQLALQREPKCALCYALLIRLSLPLGLRKEALGWFNQGLEADRESTTVALDYYTRLDRRWGGAEDEQQAFVDKLRLGGYETLARRVQAELLADQIRISSWRGPEAARPGLAAAAASLAIADNYDARYAHAYALQTLGRHAEAVDEFTQVIERFNPNAQLFETRAYSYSQLARWPEALRDLRIAYEQHLSAWAFETLVKLSAGNSGWKFRTSRVDSPELCREAALRGLAIAMTCLGGLHYFGTGGVAKDLVQARQWFRRAADAGDPQGMVDLAQMCATGQGGAVDRDAAIRLWLAAARSNHPQAQAKLDAELSVLERTRWIWWPQFEAGLRGWARAVVQLLGVVFAR